MSMLKARNAIFSLRRTVQKMTLSEFKSKIMNTVPLHFKRSC
jgi:hypothetical protein